MKESFTYPGLTRIESRLIYKEAEIDVRIQRGGEDGPKDAVYARAAELAVEEMELKTIAERLSRSAA